jgi:hypothetical protein
MSPLFIGGLHKVIAWVGIVFTEGKKGDGASTDRWLKREI